MHSARHTPTNRYRRCPEPGVIPQSDLKSQLRRLTWCFFVTCRSVLSLLRCLIVPVCAIP